MSEISRRRWLQTALSAPWLAPLGGFAAANIATPLAAETTPATPPRLLNRPPRAKLPIAAVCTVYHRASHADVILGKILEGWRQDGGPGPDLRIAAMYVDQFPETDLSRDLSARYGFPIVSRIDEALTLGTNRLQVAGVLSIGEHGDYPHDPVTGQHQYPRRRFFDAIADTFERCGQVAPVFNDKHLSWKYTDALAMVERARQLEIPLLAGSSLPVAWRLPQLVLPRDCEVEAALSIGYGGLEAYGFHALEMHACQLERRRGGETGLRAIRTVPTAELLEAGRQGEWSQKLFAAARAVMPGAPRDTAQWEPRDGAGACVLEHRDGLRSAVVMANGLAGHFSCAFQLKGVAEPVACWFKLQEGPPFGHFAHLLRAIEETVHSRRPAYPVERTLWTTGVLDRAQQSAAQGGRRLETPELDFTWQPVDWPYANAVDSPLEIPND
jgi:hypothetical protein